MNQLIKLQDKFLLVSDEEIKDGDRFYCITNQVVFTADTIEYLDGYNILEDSGHNFFIKSKIARKIIAGHGELPAVDFSLLSEADCKTIGWYDVDKISKSFAIIQTNLGCTNFHDLEFAYKEGFQDAQSLNKEFSLEDMSYIFECGRNFQLTGENNFTEGIKSLQQTSWEVEVEMGYVKLNDDGQEYGFPDMLIPKITNNSIKVTKIL